MNIDELRDKISRKSRLFDDIFEFIDSRLCDFEDELVEQLDTYFDDYSVDFVGYDRDDFLDKRVEYVHALIKDRLLANDSDVVYGELE